MMSLPVWLPSHMFLPGGLCPGGVSVQGVSVQGSLCRGSLCRGSLCRGPCPGGHYPGDLCQGANLFRGVSVQGVSVQGASAWGVSVQGVIVQGVSVQRGFCQGDAPDRDFPLYMEKSRWYAGMLSWIWNSAKQQHHFKYLTEKNSVKSNQNILVVLVVHRWCTNKTRKHSSRMHTA